MDLQIKSIKGHSNETLNSLLPLPIRLCDCFVCLFVCHFIFICLFGCLQDYSKSDFELTDFYMIILSKISLGHGNRNFLSILHLEIGSKFGILIHTFINTLHSKIMVRWRWEWMVWVKQHKSGSAQSWQRPAFSECSCFS